VQKPTGQYSARRSLAHSNYFSFQVVVRIPRSSAPQRLSLRVEDVRISNQTFSR
jgi:hypothetical protein